MEYKRFTQLLSREKVSLFSLLDLKKLFPKETKDALKNQVCGWEKKGWVRRLKKGLYELRYPEEKTLPDLYIANKLYEPSYVSLETALSYYSLIPDVAMQVTSVTTKATRRFKNAYGVFTYRSVKSSLFFGVQLVLVQGQKAKMAEPEKAFTDTIYFFLREKKPLNEENVRWNLSQVKKLNQKKLFAYAKNYNEKTYAEVRKIYAQLRRSS